MADTDQTEGDQDRDTPEEELDEHEKALLFVSRYAEARRALPWEQWTLREKACYYIDRLFIVMISLLMLSVIAGFGYQVWYVSDFKKIKEFVSELGVLLFGWLFTQDKREHLAEL